MGTRRDQARARRQLFKDRGVQLQPPKRRKGKMTDEEVGELTLAAAGAMWRAARDTSWIDEAAAGLTVVGASSFLWARYAPAEWPGTTAAAWTTWVCLLMLLVGAIAVFGTSAGRRTLKRAHEASHTARWLHRSVRSDFAEVWGKCARFPTGGSPEVIPGTEWAEGPWVDPPAGFVSLLPVGKLPTRFGFSVRPAAVDTLDPDKLKTKAAAIAEQLRQACAYPTVIPGGSYEAVTVEFTFDEMTLIPEADIVPAAVPPDRIGTRWDDLMTELDLRDTNGAPPVLTYWAVPDRPSTVLTVARTDGELFDESPVWAQGAVRPTPLQDRPQDHETIVRRFANRARMQDWEITGHDALLGVHFQMWRDGKPSALPVDGRRLDDPEVFATLAGEVVPHSDKIPPPRLVAARIGGVSPKPLVDEGERWTKELPSSVEPQPDSIALQVDVDPTADTVVANRILGSLLYYATDWRRTRQGLLLYAYRDPLAQGELATIDTLSEKADQSITLGRTFGGTVRWPFLARPHVLVSGQSGAAKGDAIALFIAGMLLRDWLVIYSNPKPTSEHSSLAKACLEVRDLDQAAALWELVRMEHGYRAWKAGQVADGRWLTGPPVSLRDHAGWFNLEAAQVADGGPRLPHFGPRIGIASDEHQMWGNVGHNAGHPNKETRKQFQTSTEGIARECRQWGAHLIIVTQVPLYDTFGGSGTGGNLSFKVLLRIDEEAGFRNVKGMDAEQKYRLANGPGKGHCFVALEDPDDPDSSKRPTEGQQFWAGESTDWLAREIVPGYMAANPGHDPRQRDYVAELADARQVFGHGAPADFENLTDDRVAEYPYILDRAPFGERSMRAGEWTWTDGPAAGGRQQVLSGAPPHPDDVAP